MKCPYCSSDDVLVIDSRTRSDNSIRRRRECTACKRRFSTYENVIEEKITVIKKDSRTQPFDSNKILNGLNRACEKTSVTQTQILSIINSVERRARKRKNFEISSKEIGDIVANELAKVDHIAYIRFSSVYREFESPDEFVATVRMLKKNKRGI